jgi:beta-galactosidase
MLKSVPMPNFWRAPTANDIGNDTPIRCGQWLLASRYAKYIQPFTYKTPADKPLFDIKSEKDNVLVKFVYRFPTLPESGCEIAYQVDLDGKITIALTYEPVCGLPDFPVFGMLIKTDPVFDRVEWYGLGPEETYADRRLGGRLGLYRGLVKEQAARYLAPQETGNKVGVRWAKVLDARGRGLIFSGDSLEFSALPYTPFELENALHPNELPLPHYTVVRVNLRQMGVAGDDSWGAPTHPEFLIPSDKRLSFSFGMKGWQ